MSPPLVVAFALAGRVDIDLTHEPLGSGTDGATSTSATSGRRWPRCRTRCRAPSTPRRTGASTPTSSNANPLWNEIPSTAGQGLQVGPRLDVHPGAAVLRPLLDDARQPSATSTTRARSRSSATRSRPTTSARPARSRRRRPPASTSRRRASRREDFNSYGSRRGNDRVMTRGTFANVRIKNLMVPGRRGRRHDLPAATASRCRSTTRRSSTRPRRSRSSSSPDRSTARAAPATGRPRERALLGVRAVIAQSFERIHRSNLVFMGVLPCQFLDGATRAVPRDRRHGDLRPDRARGGHPPAADAWTSRSGARTAASDRSRSSSASTRRSRWTTTAHGGILPYVLRQLVGARARTAGESPRL